MRFGLLVSMQRSWPEMLELHRAADQLDVFESTWTSDHLYAPGVAADGTLTTVDGPMHEAWTATAALLQATSRIRIGPLVTCVAYRNPGLLAKMVTTADIISGGRVALVLGAGWGVVEAHAFGIPLGGPKERSERFAEAVEVLHGLFVDGEVTFAGRYYQLDSARLDPRPVQQPHPPFVIGGSGERRTIPLVARYAQQWDLGIADPATTPRKRDLLARACQEIGRSPAEIRLSARPSTQPGDDPKALADRAAAAGELGIEQVVFNAAQIGNSPAVLERLADALTDLV